LSQAHRIKTEPPAIRVGILRFFRGVAREIGFWLLAAVALAMIGALLTFNPEDPAWTHTATVARFHNLGGIIGAWFADVSLYFLGYAAYLLPLGVAFAGWRLFERGALLELDGEIVLLRVLGFLVTLATVCGLMALHLNAASGTVPGAGSAGGLLGVHVSQFLIQAFQPLGGNLFMVLLLLAGLILTTGFSWLTVLDGIGAVVLKLVDWVGRLVLTPLRWAQPKAGEKSAASSAIPVGAAPATDFDSPAIPEASEPPPALPPQSRRLAAQAQDWIHALRNRVNAWWQSRREQAAIISTAAVTPPEPAPQPPSPQPPSPQPSPTEVSEASAVPPVSRTARIEPVLNWPSEPASVPASDDLPPAPRPERESPSTLDMRTLLPTVPLPVRKTAAGAMTVAPASPQPAQGLAAAAETAPAVSPPPLAEQTAGLRGGFPAAATTRPLAMPTPLAPCPLPPLKLLDPPPARTAGYSLDTLEQMSRRLEVLLKHFGIAVQVVTVEPGPVITRFEIEPAPGVKVNQISNLAKDLARGLSVISVRVVEIIPGKSVIGLEIPNQHREIVYLREVLESPVYALAASPLTLALGKEIGGNPVVANLARMPHLLVAGTTGSGKSVAINAMLLSLLYKAAPHEVRLILVDPKMLELSMYEDIPHLLTPVVTDMKEAANALRWCVVEMDRRYRLMAALKVRNIAGYNRKLADAQAAGESITDPFWKPGEGGVAGEIPLLEPLPFIVVVIDELADLMMIVGKKVEELIARLAQKARASGIHLILATQRPSVDVITGLIKANIPTRIAFQVSSRVDSRTILDQMGAEQLLGHGDMLYLPPGTGLPQRVHGAFVDDHEVLRVVDALRRSGAPDYLDDVLAEPREASEGAEDVDGNGARSGESDPLYDEAVRIVTESRRASVSGVQRRLRIGYNRAARLVEEMESAGVVGPVQTHGGREVLAPPP